MRTRWDGQPLPLLLGIMSEMLPGMDERGSSSSSKPSLFMTPQRFVSMKELAAQGQEEGQEEGGE